MAREVDNYCVSCPQGCIHCGRERDIIHYSCDDCGRADNIDGETIIYSDGAYFYCAACLLRKHMSDFIRDMIDEHGEEWIDFNYEKAPDAV